MPKPARTKTTAAATALAAGAVLLFGAAPAQAATYYVSDNCDVPWISCNYGDLRLYYNSKAKAVDSSGHLVSSWAQFYGNVSDYSGTSQYEGSGLSTYVYVFGWMNGNGNGQRVKNNAASVANCAASDDYRVYYNTGYMGHSQYFGHGGWSSCNWADLDSTLKNENASEHFA
ncbi:hypothetical protein ACFV2H_50475 [Streptomyces sp. NPDC059629]|uniref:hypothetical protein n=1 Tax=Streptomyces sp. NPDC059629 TaxID=3346889 RepID=UPI003694A232